MKKKVFKKKATAKKARKKGQPIYKVKAGWKVGKKRKAGNVLVAILLVIIGVLFVAGLAGCTAEQIGQVDKVVDSASAVVAVADATVNSPVGVFIPEPIGIVASLILTGLTTVFAFWKNNKYKLLKKVNVAVVKAVESATNNSEIKTAVAGNLASLKIYEAGKQIITESKLA